MRSLHAPPARVSAPRRSSRFVHGLITRRPARRGDHLAGSRGRALPVRSNRPSQKPPSSRRVHRTASRSRARRHIRDARRGRRRSPCRRALRALRRPARLRPARYCLECGERRSLHEAASYSRPRAPRNRPSSPPAAPPPSTGRCRRREAQQRSRCDRLRRRAAGRDGRRRADRPRRQQQAGCAPGAGRHGRHALWTEQAGLPPKLLLRATGRPPAAATTVQVQTLPVSGTAVSAVEAAKASASSKGAGAVGALKSEEFSTLPGRSYVDLLRASITARAPRRRRSPR